MLTQTRRTSLWRGLPRTVWALFWFWTMVLIAWSAVLPTFRSADELSHVVGVLRIEHHKDWPGFKSLELDEGARAAAFDFTYRNRGPQDYAPLHADAAIERGDRPSFDQLGAGTETAGARPVSIGQHPPGYYALLAGVSTILPASTPFDLEVWVLRLVSVAMLAPLPLVLAVAVRRLGGSDTAMIVAAAMPLAVPQLAATGGAINNDNLVNAAAAWVTLGVVFILAGDTRKRVAALTGLALGAALMAKAFSLVLVPFVLGAYLVTAVRGRKWASSAKAAVVALSVSMVGGWWWVYSYLRYGQIQPSGHLAPRGGGRLGLLETTGDYWPHFMNLMPTRFWASLSIKGPRRPGEAEAIAFPWSLGAALSLVLLALLLVALIRNRTGPLKRTDVLVLLWPFLSLLVVITLSTWNIFARTGVPSGLQGRYVFVGLPGVFIVLTFLTVWWTRRRHPMLVPALLTFFAMIFIALSFERVIRFHYGADHVSLAGAPRALVTWSPLAPPFLVLISLMTAASTVHLVRSLIALGGQSNDSVETPNREGAPEDQTSLVRNVP